MFGKVQEDSFQHIFEGSSFADDFTQRCFRSFSNQNSPSKANNSVFLESRTTTTTTSTPTFLRLGSLDSSLISEQSKRLKQQQQQLLQQQQQINNNNNKTNTNRYKTELCRPFQESGSCKYGEKCQFAHGKEELRAISRHPKYKTDLCRTYHSVGFCPYGPRCHFIHNLEEAKSSSGSSSSPSSSSATPTSTTGMPPLPIFSSNDLLGPTSNAEILLRLRNHSESGYTSQSSSSSVGQSPSDFETDSDVSSASSPMRLPVFSTMSK